MKRIRPLRKEQAQEDIRHYFEQDEATYGTVLNTTGVYAHCPPILAASKQFGAALAQSGRLPPGLRSLLNVYVASLVGCPY